jgi:hypothetical protein
MVEGIFRDIIILVLGIVGGYIAAVLGGLHTSRWANFLNNRKLLKTQKSKQQALQVYNRIKAFHEGKRDKYPYYLLLASGAVICAILGSTLILIISIQSNEYPVSIGYGIVALFAVMFIAMGMVFLGAIYETARQIERFGDYTKEFEERWGPID